MSYEVKKYYHQERDEAVIYLCGPLSRLDGQYGRLFDDGSDGRGDVKELDQRHKILVAAERALNGGYTAVALALMHRELIIQGFRER